MLFEKLVQRTFSTETNGIKDEDGYWKVTMTCTEANSEDGNKFEEESISFMGIDRDFDEAQKTTLRAYYSWMETFAWSKGIVSLVEAKRLAEGAEVSDGNSPEGDEVTTV